MGIRQVQGPDYSSGLIFTRQTCCRLFVDSIASPPSGYVMYAVFIQCERCKENSLSVFTSEDVFKPCSLSCNSDPDGISEQGRRLDRGLAVHYLYQRVEPIGLSIRVPERIIYLDPGQLTLKTSGRLLLSCGTVVSASLFSSLIGQEAIIRQDLLSQTCLY
jgi:hypothetical protein